MYTGITIQVNSYKYIVSTYVGLVYIRLPVIINKIQVPLKLKKNENSKYFWSLYN